MCRYRILELVYRDTESSPFCKTGHCTKALSTLFMDFTQGSLHQYLGTLWRTILSKPKILHQYFGALLRTILSKPKVLHQHLGALLRTVLSRIQTPCSIWMLVHQNCAKGVTKRKYIKFPVYFSVIQDCHQP